MTSNNNVKSMGTNPHMPDNKEDEDEITIDLLELMYHLFDKKWFIIVMIAAGLLLMTIYSFFVVKPQYSATSKLYVLSNDDDAIISISSLQMGTSLANDYMRIFDIREVREEVCNSLENKYSIKLTTEGLSDMVSVSNPSGTRFLYITAIAGDAQIAANVANEYRDVVINAISTIMGTTKPRSASDAAPSIVPISPNKTINMLIGAFVGMFVAIIIITLQFILDVKVKTSDDIRKYVGIETLGIVPVFQEKLPDNPKKHTHIQAFGIKKGTK